MAEVALCSNCFHDQGLRLDAEQIGAIENSACPNCGSTTGRKLNGPLVELLAHRFFVWGTIHRSEYGAAPAVEFNRDRKTNISLSVWLERDVRLMERAIGVGFFHYGPRLWMIGEVEPLRALQQSASRAPVIHRILAEYPVRELKTS